ncbi:MAG TPA: hypothetical protein VE954_42025, partial [Oligoflexus sp.]
LSEFAAISLASKLRTGSVDFAVYVPSKVAQEIGKRAFRAVERKMFGKAKRCRFKRKGSDFSLKGSSNKESPQIKITGETAWMIFRKKEYPLNIDQQNPYHRQTAIRLWLLSLIATFAFDSTTQPFKFQPIKKL